MCCDRTRHVTCEGMEEGRERGEGVREREKGESEKDEVKGKGKERRKEMRGKERERRGEDMQNCEVECFYIFFCLHVRGLMIPVIYSPLILHRVNFRPMTLGSRLSPTFVINCL